MRTKKEVAQLDRLRGAAGLTVADLTRELLDVSRATYYNWMNGSDVRKSRMPVIKKASKVIALCIRDAKLPISNEFKGKEHRHHTVEQIQYMLHSLNYS